MTETYCCEVKRLICDANLLISADKKRDNR